MKTFDVKITAIGGQVWTVAMPVPLEIARFFIQGGSKRIVCTVNGTETFQAALLPTGDGNFFILLNKERRTKLNLQLGDTAQITLEADNSEYGLPMPEELQELLYQDPEGDAIFQALTPGKQRSLLHIIGKPKSSNIRLNKALTVINYLKSVGGKLDFKELNLALKTDKF